MVSEPCIYNHALMFKGGSIVAQNPYSMKTGCLVNSTWSSCKSSKAPLIVVLYTTRKPVPHVIVDSFAYLLWVGVWVVVL